MWFNVYFFLNKFNHESWPWGIKRVDVGYGLVDHESFCIVTNEGGALISVAHLTVVVNKNMQLGDI